jgi:hypothetical protein
MTKTNPKQKRECLMVRKSIRGFSRPNIFNIAAISAALCAVAFCITPPAHAETTAPLPRADAFFGIHFDLHPNAADTILGRDATPANIAEFLDRVKPDFVQYDCKGHPGYTGYPTKVGYPSPGIVKDALALWRAETRKRNIGLYIHYSGVWDAAAIAHHPEWARIDENGRPDPNITSRWSPYADQLMIPQLTEAATNYQLDGVWVDGDCWGAKLDYCTTAAEQFKQQTGIAPPPKSSKEPGWEKWKAFHRRAFEDYLVHWTDALHKARPGIQICSNWSYSSFMPIPIRAGVDFLSGDFSAKESVDRARFEGRYLASTGKPWDLMAWGFNGFEGGSAGATQLKTPLQLQQEAAVVIALGGGVQVYFNPTRGGYITPAVREIAGQVADFSRPREKLSHRSSAIPQVALLLSTTSYLRRSDNVYNSGGQFNPLEGALHALLESGYSVDLLAEHQLTDEMKDFPVIAIAQAPALRDAFKNKVLEYVRAGGRLLLLDYESTQPFKDELGLKYAEPADVTTEAYVGTTSATAPVPGKWANIAATGDNSAILDLRTNRDGILTAAADGTTTGMFPWVETAPAVTSTTLGRGAIIAIHGPASAAFFQSHHPVLRRWIAQSMEVAFPNPAVRLAGTPGVDVTYRRATDGTPIVHLVNLTNAQRANRFAAVDSIPPAGPATLQWRLDRKPAGFTQLPEKRELPFSLSEDRNAPLPFTAAISIADIPLHSLIVPTFAE